MHFNYIFYLIFIKYFSRILYNSLYIANEFVFEIINIPIKEIIKKNCIFQFLLHVLDWYATT